MKTNNPLPPDPKEQLLGELLLEITRNVFAASALQGLTGGESWEFKGTEDRAQYAFAQADEMMRHSKLPELITKLQKLK